MPNQKVDVHTIPQRFRDRDDRHIARMCRSTKNTLLEMHAETMAYRAILADYERWTKTPEFQKESERLDKLVAQLNELFPEDGNPSE